MFKTFLLALLCFLSMSVARGTTYTYGVTSGDATISMSAVASGLKPGDTLLLPGRYSSLSFKGLKGTSRSKVYVVQLPGSTVSTPFAYVAGDLSDCEYVVFIGLNYRNFLGVAHQASVRCHDLEWKSCSYINDLGKYSNQQVFLFDNKYTGNAMVFNGNKATTFYNISVHDCYFSGFRENTVFAGGTDGLRSVCLDFSIENNQFVNLSNYVNIAPAWIGGMFFNLQCHYNSFDSTMADAKAYQKVHTGNISLYGNGDIGMNYFGHSYANDVRAVPLVFKGLPGYDGPLAVHDNIFHAHLSYGGVEVSHNNAGPRLANKAFDTASTVVEHNTLVSTKRASYNGDWYGAVADIYTTRVRLRYNVAVDPENDRPWDPVGRNYVASFPNGWHVIDSAGNHVYRTAKDAGIDTTTWTLAQNSPLLDHVTGETYLVDFHGNPRPANQLGDWGAVERQASVVPVRTLIAVTTYVQAGKYTALLTYSDGTTRVEQ